MARAITAKANSANRSGARVRNILLSMPITLEKDMEIRTHRKADPELVGRPIELGDGWAKVELMANERMAVDERGLVHGAFTFAAADLAAMLAVNRENVVLARAELKFLRPVKVGDRMVAEARILRRRNDHYEIMAKTMVEGKVVMEGLLYAVVPKKHVLNKK